MKTCIFAVVAALVLQVPPATPGEQPPSTRPDEAEQRNVKFPAMEKKLLGTWYGPACGGDYTFKADGTYVLRNFTPGNNTLIGTWSIRWDALPPTLLVTCKASDFTKRDPTRSEYEHVKKTLEYKLVELNDNSFAYRLPDEKRLWRFSRRADEGGSTEPVE